MDNNQEALFMFFKNSWDSMISLLGNARSIEFLIRIASEILEHETFCNSRKWNEFNTSKLSVTRKELDQHIRDIWGEEANQINHIKQICDKLAHADYPGAKNRIDAWKEKYNLSTILNKELANIINVTGVTFEDGQSGQISIG